MYINYYGFSAKPFQLRPDPQFFFGSSGHKRAMAYLRYGLNQAEGFIVITGGIGTGKTTLVNSLFKELDSNSVAAAQLVTTQLLEDDLLRMVAAAFALPYENGSKAALLKRFEEFLKNCARDGKRVLLVIDEAQNLPMRSLEELRMLSNFQVADAPLLQSFLLGQEGFRDTLQAPVMEQLRQRVIASCHLSPLSEQETRAYIEHRLQMVDWQGDPQFTEEAYAAVYHYTRGIPRRINLFCDRLLLYGCLEEIRIFSEDVVKTVGEEFALEASGIEPSERPVVNPKELDYSDLQQRIMELEQAVDALLQHPQWEEVQLERLEKRLKKLEPATQALRQELAALIQRVNAALGVEADESR